MKAKNKWLALGGLLILLVCLAQPAYALRKRTRKARSSGGGQAVQTSRGIRSQVRFRPDRKGLLLNLSGFSNIESVRYELSYVSNGISQGAGGTIVSDDTSTKELLFGTCSAGVCTYHTNITNARLSIISTLKDGTKVLKPYRIKV